MRNFLTIVLTLFLFSGLTLAQWNTQTVDNSGDVGKFSDIAYDSQGYPHIAYFDDTSDKIMYAFWNGTAWEIENVGNTGLVGCSIALDNQDKPHIAVDSYYWRKNVNNQWESIAYQYGGWNFYPDICIYFNPSTGQSIPHIVYYRSYSTELNLRHAYLDPSTGIFVLENIDQANDVGLNPHIICDDSENLYVSYYDQGAGALKFAHYNGTQWSTAVIDDLGDVGRYNSIALDASGNPCISYYDETNGDLKYVVINNITSKTNKNMGENQDEK